ncbi:zinc ribbon domain-containing protein [Rubripirellula reticaptiva]|uniref:Glycerophosphoryl diester phosphodiesterase membrane domain-containing protein n=1 Tax=Rubripirellula reticaptiva TaxID=2528013 RepID=A0A5C6EIY7_9BACT|nr:hypothetical protein [Rubripirellula reticaptiva]TWU48415.1 hypothetical protein Poly59_52630 [Rubripirellula reticaptiva]
MLRQTCPSCNRLLELPETAAGKMAKCPACQTQFTVPASPSADLGSGSLSPAAATSAPLATGESPFSRPIGGSIDSESHRPAATNPYQPSAATPMNVSVGELAIGQRSVEEIFGVTWAIFKERWGILVGGYVLVFAISVVAAFGPNLVTLVVGPAAGQDVAAVLSGVLSLFCNLLSTYFTLGFCGVALAVARDESSPLSKLTPSLLVFGRFLLGVIVIMLGAGVLFGIFGVIAALAFAAGVGEGAAIGLILLAVLVALPLMLVMYWLLWSWAYIVIDERADWLGSLKASFAITMQNKLTSVLLIVITTMLSFAGVLACYFGLLVTTPLWMLMLGVGYLMITGQPLSDPRLRMASDFAPRPDSPQF